MIEVWLLQTLSEEGHYLEMFLHVPNTNLWFTDQGASQEDITDVGSLKCPYDYVENGYYEHLFTKIGEL